MFSQLTAHLHDTMDQIVSLQVTLLWIPVSSNLHTPWTLNLDLPGDTALNQDDDTDCIHTHQDISSWAAHHRDISSMTLLQSPQAPSTGTVIYSEILSLCEALVD